MPSSHAKQFHGRKISAGTCRAPLKFQIVRRCVPYGAMKGLRCWPALWPQAKTGIVPFALRTSPSGCVTSATARLAKRTVVILTATSFLDTPHTAQMGSKLENSLPILKTDVVEKNVRKDVVKQAGAFSQRRGLLATEARKATTIFHQIVWASCQ